MKPNTPHAVFTPEHSVAFGGHFYATSNIQDSFFSIVHSFIGNYLVTNVEHGRARSLLLRMMQCFYRCLVLAVDPDGGLSIFVPFLSLCLIEIFQTTPLETFQTCLTATPSSMH